MLIKAAIKPECALSLSQIANIAQALDKVSIMEETLQGHLFLYL